MNRFKRLIEKLKRKAEMLVVSLTLILANMNNVFADVTPNTEEGKNLVKPWIAMFLDILLWALPGACIIFIGGCALKWFTSLEEERQHHNPMSNIKKALMILVISESIVAILRVFGIGWTGYN
ncbi:hypothetical protein [Faecalibacillus faecis]|jgi:hypothetical protein|uniref:hypothetical protein n=1 Tax=Faecalibacillus faecis TaxID=1982628 RepID=UPI002F924EB9